MTSEQRARLQEIINEVNLSRIFKDIDDLGRRIEEFAARYASKSRAVASDALPPGGVSLDSVIADFRSNPYRVKVLLQAMAFLCTPEMLTMIWMSELGCTIQTLTLDYARHDHAELKIELRLLDASTLCFHSAEVWDLAVLRLVGLAKADEAPEMSGFYPLFLPASSSGSAS